MSLPALLGYWIPNAGASAILLLMFGLVLDRKLTEHRGQGELETGGWPNLLRLVPCMLAAALWWWSGLLWSAIAFFACAMVYALGLPGDSRRRRGVRRDVITLVVIAALVASAAEALRWQLGRSYPVWADVRGRPGGFVLAFPLLVLMQMSAMNPFMNMRGVSQRIGLYVTLCLAPACASLLLPLGAYQAATFYACFLVCVGTVAVVGALHSTFIVLPTRFLLFEGVLSKQALLEEFAQEAAAMSDRREGLEARLELLLQNLYRVLHFDHGFIAARNAAGELCVRYLGPPPDDIFDSLGDAMRVLGRDLTPGFPAALRRVLLLEPGFDGPEGQDGQRHDPEQQSFHRYPRIERSLNRLVRTLTDQGHGLYMPLEYRGRLLGTVFASARSDGPDYFMGEIKLLESAAPTCALSLHNTIQWELMNRRAAPDGWDQAGEPADALGTVEREPMEVRLGDRSISYRSTAMAELVERTRQVSGTRLPVLIRGETGTGKELIARLIHRERPGGRGAPFVAVNCSAIPESLWEAEVFGARRGAFTGAQHDRAGYVTQAADGVLFFDEIGELPLHVQPRILRLVQERQFQPLGASKPEEVRCRLVFATHRDLGAMVKAGQFREDLFYRINVHLLELQPLRRRREDILPIAASILRRNGFSEDLTEVLEEEALTRLQSYDWPGNVRQLENCLLSALALRRAGRLSAAQLYPGGDSGAASLRETPRDELVSPVVPAAESAGMSELLRDYRRRLIAGALRRTEGNRSAAARLLKVKRGKLLYQMKELGLE